MKKENILNQNNRRVSKLKKKIENYDNDIEKESRTSKCLCKYCSYINVERIAGQSFTHTKCSNCGKEMVFPTTDIDDYCDSCAKEINVCKHCGSEMD